MTRPDDEPGDGETRRLAAAADDPTAWFEQLYAGGGPVPWDRAAPSASLVAWFETRPGDGRATMVVGCGHGRDAEFLASIGYAVTAFDVSPTAIEQARERHPGSPVDYCVADLLDLPAAWHGAFGVVVESYTVQALPPSLHAAAATACASLVGPGGTLLVLGAVGDGQADGPPWPLTRDELAYFAVGGVTSVAVETVDGKRWRAEYRRG